MKWLGNQSRIWTVFSIFAFNFSFLTQSLVAIPTRPTEIPHGIVYVVRAQDTLAKIANRFSVSVANIRSLNNLTQDRWIYPGQVLKIAARNVNVAAKLAQPKNLEKLEPAKSQLKSRWYVVKSGDTLSKISKKSQVSVNILKKINQLKNTKLSVGQRLKLKIEPPEQPIEEQLAAQDKMAPQYNDLDPELAEYLAQEAQHIGKRKNSFGHCLRSVRQALNRVREKYLDVDEALIHTLGENADSFRRLVNRDPIYICQQLGLADVSSLELPYEKGTIYIWRKGRCGFSNTYGHIEVVVDNLAETGCSDHCRPLRSCAPDLKLAFVKNCDWLVKENVQSALKNSG